jgi:hypothetical protein
MKKQIIQPEGFRDLTNDENQLYTGGGFAFDAGRFIRFALIAGPMGVFTPMAVVDFAGNMVQ